MNQKMFFSLFLILAAYFGVHYFVFRSGVVFLKIENQKTKVAFFSGMLFLATSFIVATFLIHSTDNLIARGYYFLSGIWVGIVLNLFLAWLAVWFVFTVSQRLGLDTNLRIIALGFCFLALIFSFWGVWNVYNPIVRRIEVKVDGLPERWKGKTVVQLSDIHLGNVLRQGYMEKLARQVDNLNPEIVFLTGDIFDGVGSDVGSFILPLSHIEAPKGIYYVNGNHETYLGLEKSYAAVEKAGINILDDQIVQVDGIQVFGLSYPGRDDNKDIGKIFDDNKKFFSQKPTILLSHAPTHIKEAQTAGISLQLSGHTHHGQLFPLGFITRMIFKGYDFGLHQVGNFSIYASSGAGVWGPTMKTSSRSEIVAITLR